MKWVRQSKGVYACAKNGAVITRDGSLWRRTEGPARARGWYPTLRDAKRGQGGRRVWHRRQRGVYERIDGVQVRHSADRGARGCWQVLLPPGLPKATIYGSRLAAQRAAAREVPLQAGSRGGPRPPEERTPDRASRMAEQATGTRQRPAASKVDEWADKFRALRGRVAELTPDQITQRLQPYRRLKPDLVANVVRRLGYSPERSRAANVALLRTVLDGVRNRQEALKHIDAPASKSKARDNPINVTAIVQALQRAPVRELPAETAGIRQWVERRLRHDATSNIQAAIEQLGYPRPRSRKAAIQRAVEMLLHSKRTLRQTDRIGPGAGTLEQQLEQQLKAPVKVPGWVRSAWTELRNRVRTIPYDQFGAEINRALGDVPTAVLYQLVVEEQGGRRPASRRAALTRLADVLRQTDRS